MYFDLNDFKQINDNFGHAEGDKVLVTFSDLMSKNLRNSDIFARLGGDEFVALLIDTPETGVLSAIEKLQTSLDQQGNQAKDEYKITFSHGITAFDPEKHKGIDDLLAESDAAMYRHKKEIKSA